MRKNKHRAPHLLMALLLAALPIAWPRLVVADALQVKSVTIGNSAPSAVTTHRYAFTYASVSNVGSIEFEYCTNTPFVGDSCTAPVGFSATGAAIQSQTGETGFSVSGLTTANRLILTRASVPTAAIPATYTLGNMVNPSPNNSTVYVRISTFATEDATGPRTDEGAVAFATTRNVTVEGFVPPYITFCVGVVVALNCTSSTGDFLDFGELVTNQARFVSSQFSVATNDPAGYSTTVAGPTMTSGNNIINAVNPPQPSQPGTGQFGMNLRANSNPSVGGEPIGIGTGVIAAGYGTPNQFYFNNQVIASSATSSDFNAFTVSYIVNVDGGQRPGIYSTTLTYIASAAF